MYTAPYLVLNCDNGVETEYNFIIDVAVVYANTTANIEVVDANGVIIPLDILRELI